MTVQAISGSFPLLDFSDVGSIPGLVLNEKQDPTFGFTPSWSTGAVRVADITLNPSQMQEWIVVGFSFRLVFSWSQSRVAGESHSPRFGDLWGGLNVDSPMVNLNGDPIDLPAKAGTVQLPQNLSTFTKLWSGQTDPPPPQPKVVGGEAPPNGSGVLGTTYMLPAPVPIHPGARLQMVLIALSKLAYGGTNFTIMTADFSVLYEAAPRG